MQTQWTKPVRLWSDGLPILAALSLVALAGRLKAGEPLEFIPGNVAGVVIVRNLDESKRKLDEFLRAISPDHAGIDLSRLEQTLDCPVGTWDTSKPVAFILTLPSFDFFTNPEFSETPAVLAFTPKSPRTYQKQHGIRPNAVSRIEQCGRPYYLLMRDGVVFVGGRRRQILSMKNVPSGRSLAAALTDEQRELAARSDLFIHLPLAQWRDKLAFLMLLGANMAKLGMATEQDPRVLEAASVAIDWLSAGIRNVLEEMQSLTVAASFDGTTFRVVHSHAFRPGGKTARYLASVRRSGVDLSSPLPDRPFYMLACFDWQCPPELAVSTRLNRRILTADFVREKIGPETISRLLEASDAFGSGLQGSFAMMTSRPNRLYPLEVLGGYATSDAAKSAEILRFIQENTTEAIGPFVGGGYVGKFALGECDDREYFELRFDSEKLGPTLGNQLTLVYGEDARLQQAVLDDRYVVYSISADPKAICTLVETKGVAMGANPLVRRVRSRLPEDANGLVVLDIGRCLAVMPQIVRYSVEKSRPGALAELQPRPQAADQPTERPPVPPSGPLIGWACVVHPNSLTGHLVIDADDVFAAGHLARKMSAEIEGVFRGRRDGPLPRPRP